MCFSNKCRDSDRGATIRSRTGNLELCKFLVRAGKALAQAAAAVRVIDTVASRDAEPDKNTPHRVPSALGERTSQPHTGTKRTTRWRIVPLVSNEQRSLIEHAIKHAQGVNRVLFLPWQNVRRDPAQAYDRAGIEPCTPGDLRLRGATRLRYAGADRI